MKPLSRKKRLSYLFVLTIVFFLAVPVVILYAIGYRPSDVSWLDVSSTGGIFVRAEGSNVEVYVDGVIKKKTGIFQHSFLVPNLKPGVHELLVKAEGRGQWVKQVEVFAEKVTEINPYLISEKIALELLPKYVLPDGTVVTATTTADLKKIKNKVLNPDHVSVSKLFTATSSSSLVSTSSRVMFAYADFNFTNKKGLILKNKLALWQADDGLSVQWLGDQDGAQYYFCSNEVCSMKKSIPVNDKVSHFDFYPGKDNHVLVALSEGIYMYEIDDRVSVQNRAVVVPGKDLDFRVGSSGVLYVKDGDSIYVADL